jgi:hypothetical protein
MIKTQSEDPDVQQAAKSALDIINDVLAILPKAETFDYGGHTLKINEYGVCDACTIPIAEAQAADKALHDRAESEKDETIKEHLDIAAQFYHLESEAAILRAELHNGFGTEQILNRLLGYAYDRHIGEDYHHSHHGGQQ